MGLFALAYNISTEMEVFSLAKREINLIVGKNVRYYRTLRGLTRAQLAQMANISVSFVGNIETGARPMSIMTLRKIANALEVPTNWLVFECGKNPGIPDTYQ